LRLCGDYGIDEENDAEAKAFLRQIKNDGSIHQYAGDPLHAAWEEAHHAYDPAVGDKNNDKQAIVDYRTQLESTYGVTFSSIKGAGDWDLLRIRMVHVGLEMAAAALGHMARSLGYHWGDATAFRRIIGEIDLILSGVKHRNDAPAEVVGRQITFYLLEERDRLAYPIPNLVLHELGHVFNTNAGFGNRDRIGSINATVRHPVTLDGMGAPDPNRLLTEDKDTLYLYDKSWEDLVPPLHYVLGFLHDGDKLIHDMKYADQIQLMRQSWEGTKNEITADAFLNWVYYRNTKGASGFTGDEKGQSWQRFMNENMDVWIRNAITYEIVRRGEPISLTKADKDLMPFPVPVERGVTEGSEGPNVRTGPSTRSGIHSTLLLGREVIILGRDHADEDPDNNWVAVLYDGDVHWIWQHGVQLPDGVLWTDLTPLDKKHRKLTYDFSTSTQEDDSWFPILLSAAYGE
ncbi:MAG: SH3 domain-containing protein, partial [Gemmatimonadota bacterium]|nr:SH3 domain-containing protein [Gemmatimonadota bacterium]